jgi:hypothetical protein
MSTHNYSANLKLTIKGPIYTSGFTVPFDKTLNATLQTYGKTNNNRMYTYSCNLHLFNTNPAYTTFANWKSDYLETGESTLECLSATPRSFNYNGPGPTISCSVSSGNPLFTITSTMTDTSYCVLYIDAFITQFE